jgi:hypothetical protein
LIRGGGNKGIVGEDDVKQQAPSAKLSGDNTGENEEDRKPAARKRAPIPQGPKKKAKLQNAVDGGKAGSGADTEKQDLAKMGDGKKTSEESSVARSPKEKGNKKREDGQK